MNKGMTIHEALQEFAANVHDKMAVLTPGEPEDQLRAPFEAFIGEVSAALGFNAICAGEIRLPDKLGKPDYAIYLNRVLSGYVELKAPGTGADSSRFTARNLTQWNRFQHIPNLIYSDGNEWALYRDGRLSGMIMRLSGDIVSNGRSAVNTTDAQNIERLFRDFFSWQPFIPTDREGKIDLRRFATMIAPLCGMLRDDVQSSLRRTNSHLVQLATDWRQLLFPDASDSQFADAYSQTVTFALLLGRSEGADPLTLESAERALAAQHSLLSRALQVLTDRTVLSDLEPSLDLLIRVIDAAPPAALTGSEDLWLYFYEDFLAAYDPRLRRDAGAYYTPLEVVHAQVSLVDQLLVNRLGKIGGFGHPDVITLDPAVGTGTYLLGVIKHVLNRIEVTQGVGAVPGQASALATNIYGFEIMVGPYAVSELRVTRALLDRGATLPLTGPHIYLTDTLESPHARPPQLPLFLRPIAEQHVRALQVKERVPVIVCLGNPPYDRTEAADENNIARTGGWVRWGDDGTSENAIFGRFLQPAIAAGHGVRLHNLYNLYAYFWCWALWKVFEHDTAGGPGIVSFISAASYLEGDAFCGMREHMRRICDEIWILDLGGEGRGTRRNENVFAIQTPVAIAVAVRSGQPQLDRPAEVHYSRIVGSREEKLQTLDSVTELNSVLWDDCPSDWQAPFRPAGQGCYFDWPLLIDLMPWQHSGVQVKRTWPIAPDADTLRRRWQAMLVATDRSEAFHGSGDREIYGRYEVALSPYADLRPIAQLPPNEAPPPIVTYAYRSFDRQSIIADGRLISRPRPALWNTQGSVQLYLTTLLNHPLGRGAALTVAATVPDMHYFRGSYGAKEVFPLYRNPEGTVPNILPGLLQLLEGTYGRTVTPENFVAYLYGIIAQPAFTARYWDELDTRELRVPITRDSHLFDACKSVGERLLWLHTYGLRFVPEGRTPGQIPRGVARCVRAISENPANYPDSFDYISATQSLVVGTGEFQPVSQNVFDFQVSGLFVLRSWLGYRMRAGAGRTSSPLDQIRPESWTVQFTTELLELLWVIEATIETYPAQADLLRAVVAGPLFEATELPTVAPEFRTAPTRVTPQDGPRQEELL